MPDEERDAIKATLPERWAATADDPSRWGYLALVEGVPVAEGSVRPTIHGPLWLAGGVTLPSFGPAGTTPSGSGRCARRQRERRYVVPDPRAPRVPRRWQDPVAGRPQRHARVGSIRHRVLKVAPRAAVVVLQVVATDGPLGLAANPRRCSTGMCPLTACLRDLRRAMDVARHVRDGNRVPTLQL